MKQKRVQQKLTTIALLLGIGSVAAPYPVQAQLVSQAGASEQVVENSGAPASEASEALTEPTKKEQRQARRTELKAKVDALLERAPEQQDYTTEERCLSTNRIRSVQVLDNQHVAFRLNRNEYYLVQFENRCPGMRRGQAVIYESRSSRLCVYDAIRTVEDFGFAGLQPGMKCFIPGFQSVTKEQVDGLKTLLKNRPRGS